MIITHTVIQVNTSVSSIFDRGCDFRRSSLSLSLSLLSLSLSLLLSDSRAYLASDIGCWTLSLSSGRAV